MLEKTKELITPEMQESYSELYYFIVQSRPRKVPSKYLKYSRRKGELLGYYLIAMAGFIFCFILFLSLIINTDERQNMTQLNLYWILPLIAGIIFYFYYLTLRHQRIKNFKGGIILTAKFIDGKLYDFNQYESYYKINWFKIL